MLIKQLHNHYTGKILQNKRTGKINIFNAIPKTLKVLKFTVDGSEFLTFITLSTKKIGLMLAMHLGLNTSVSCSTQFKEITKIGTYKTSGSVV